MTNDTRKQKRLVVIGALMAVGALLFPPTTAEAQTQEFFVCYIPNSGVLYRVNPPGSPGESPELKDDCTGKKHVKFSWAKLLVGDGKVGIGTSTPTAELDVVGDIHASGKLSLGNTIVIDDATNSITSTSGALSFDDEDLVTTGTIESTSGGFKFPDGSVQTSAVSVMGGAAWSLTGNSGTDGGTTNFMGTTDNVALELHVNGERALRLEPNATSPNLIGGFSGNSVGGGVSGGTIGGGGQSGVGNQVLDSFGTVGGGSSNEAGLGGGQQHATVGGGFDNAASGEDATVSGGSFNTASGPNATVGGGLSNTADGDRATVGGGSDNNASNLNATVGGGSANTASGSSATVPGGQLNFAGGNFSFAAGQKAKANHDGSFVWADQTNADFASTAPDQFLIRASGGVGIGTTSPSTALEVNGTIKATAFDIGYEIVIGPRGTVTTGFSPLLTATCPSGKRVLGGGADIDFVSGATPLITVSRPTDGGTGWVAIVRKRVPAQTDFDAFAVAICARV